jgi:hypothetical protein
LQAKIGLGRFSIRHWLIFQNLRSSDFSELRLCPSALEFALRVSTAINEDVRLDMRVKTKELTERQNLR